MAYYRPVQVVLVLSETDISKVTLQCEIRKKLKSNNLWTLRSKSTPIGTHYSTTFVLRHFQSAKVCALMSEGVKRKATCRELS